MKHIQTGCLVLATSILSLTSARSDSLLPPWRFKTLPATDDSLQHCRVIRTTPGVLYRIESTHDFSTWETESEIYGLGHEYAVPMRESIPAPPPDPGDPAPQPVVTPSVAISLWIRPSSDTDGGTVVSWRSLDHAGPVTKLLSEEMSSSWDTVPFYWNQFGDHSFFIMNFMTEADPPAAEPTLATGDAAMFAELENNFTTINAEVDASAALSRNTPPPAPPSPDSRKFWRVRCDWSLDTDSDGSPDWAEFQLAANPPPGHIPGTSAAGDPSSADSNHNGIPDGEELDTDLDGTMDAFDIALKDPTATFEIGPVPRYAMFQIPAFTVDCGNPPNHHQANLPIQINDRGTVLCKDRVWSAGEWTMLDDADLATHGGLVALDINNHDQIIGTSFEEIFTTDSGTAFFDHCFSVWSTPSASPTVIRSGEMSATIPACELEHGYIPSPGPVLSDDGYFATIPVWMEERTNESGITTQSPAMGEARFWQLTANGISDVGPAHDHRLYFNAGPDLRWGSGSDLEPQPGPVWPHARKVYYGSGFLPAPPFDPANITPGPLGGLLAMPAGTSSDTSRYHNPATGNWEKSDTYAQAIDIASDGTAIGKNHDNLKIPILVNGKWTTPDRYAPDSPATWKNSAENTDCSEEGWILQTNRTTGESAALLPIRMEARFITSEFDSSGVEKPLTLTDGTGVDDTSPGATQPDPAAGDHIWIMAPAVQGATEIYPDIPLNGNTPLILSANGGLKFGSGTTRSITGPDDAFALWCPGGAEATGSEVPISLKLGTVESVSRPLMAKVMKRRTVKVTVHKIGRKLSADGDPIPPDESIIPTRIRLERYLDNIFTPQINVDIAITIDPTDYALQWDLPDSYGRTNGVLDNHPTNHDLHSSEQTLIADAVAATDADIRIFLVSSEGGLSSAGDAYGMTCRAQATCWVLGSRVLENRTGEFVMHTIAHEIGHVFVGYGHPDQRIQQGPAPLPGTRHSDRLMCSGRNITSKSRILVKGEWDEAEKWLDRTIKESN